MARRILSREFKVEAVRLVGERGVSVAQAARDLDIDETMLRRWAKELTADPVQAFPGHGQSKPEPLEIERLRREVAKLRAERDILNKAAAFFAREAKQRSVWPVSWLCEALDLSRSGFHAWLHRGPSARAQFDEQLTAKVRTSFVGSAPHLGRAPGLARCPGRGRGMRPPQDRAADARQRLSGATASRGLPKDDGQRSPIVAPNVLDRQFAAERPNPKWIADFTYVWTAERWLYVAAVIDLFSPRVVGWSMKAEMTAQLVTDALMMAIWRRRKPDALLHHSDRHRQVND